MKTLIMNCTAVFSNYSYIFVYAKKTTQFFCIFVVKHWILKCVPFLYTVKQCIQVKLSILLYVWICVLNPANSHAGPSKTLCILQSFTHHLKALLSP